MNCGGPCKTTHKEFPTSRREMRTVAIVDVAHVAVGRGSQPPCGQRTPRKTKGRYPPRASAVATIQAAELSRSHLLRLWRIHPALPRSRSFARRISDHAVRYFESGLRRWMSNRKLSAA